MNKNPEISILIKQPIAIMTGPREVSQCARNTHTWRSLFLLRWAKWTRSFAWRRRVHSAQKQENNKRENDFIISLLLHYIHRCIYTQLLLLLLLHLFYSRLSFCTCIETQRTCRSQSARLQFGSLCCLHRSFYLLHWRGRELRVFALCLLLKKTTGKSTIVLHIFPQEKKVYVFVTLKCFWAACLLIIFCLTRPPAGATEYVLFMNP